MQNPKSKIELLLVNTRFSCLARLSEEYNFEPVWRPRFVSDLVPEDRCHLNGLAVVDGRPKYVTALGTTDTPGGWRQHKADGGVLVDVETDETILAGLSMPHSPRWYGGRLWVLNSGTGELLLVDPAGGKSEAVCGLRGYLRGLAFVGPYALVGLCKIREKHIFGGLPIQKRHEKLLCGVVVVDLRRGAEVGMFEFTSGCEELYDVQFLPGVRRPMILNLDKPAVRQAVTNPDSSYWLRASAEIHEETKPSSLS
ncbi:MAG: TIGR03032 family protein [Pirellulales bacterium]|nr:TIGR03032 family protein [Pirellulales bacterium]